MLFLVLSSVRLRSLYHSVAGQMRRVFNKIVSADAAAHAYITCRWPRTLVWMDRILGAIYEILRHPLFALISAALLGVLAITGVVNTVLAFLVFAWVLFILGVARSDLIRRLTIPSRIIALMVTGVLLAFLYRGFGIWAVGEYQQQQAKQQKGPEAISSPFSVEVRSAFVSVSGPMTLYMVGYPSMFGDTASSVFYLAYIQITNLQEVDSTISEFQVSAKRESDISWEDLVPIPLGPTSLYALGTKRPVPKRILMKHGTYGLVKPMTVEDMKHAAGMIASPILEAELTRPIRPHMPISGWVAFDSPARKGMTPPGPMYFRITLRDTANRGESYVVRPPTSEPNDSTMSITNGSLLVTGALFDISSFHVKYYSDPFPTPKQ